VAEDEGGERSGSVYLHALGMRNADGVGRQSITKRLVAGRAWTPGRVFGANFLLRSRVAFRRRIASAWPLAIAWA